MKPYLEDKHDLVNDSEKFEVKILMLSIYFPFCLSTACKCCVMKKMNKIPLLTLRYFVLPLIPAFFFKIYPYLTTKYPLLGDHMSPQSKSDIVNGDGRVRRLRWRVFPASFGRTHARIKDKFLQSRILYHNIFVCRSGSRNLV